MLTKFALVMAAGLAVAMVSGQAQATPMAPAKQVYQNPSVTLVADRCGRGWHWSVRWGRCVR